VVGFLRGKAGIYHAEFRGVQIELNKSKSRAVFSVPLEGGTKHPSRSLCGQVEERGQGRTVHSAYLHVAATRK